MQRAVFLDKDGTLIEDVPYNVDIERIRLMPGALDALRTMQNLGYVIIVISNQSGVAFGYFEECALDAVGRRLHDLLAEGGVVLDGWYYCPHHVDGWIERYAATCECRKPQPGLLMQAARDHGIDVKASWMIGDILNDVEAGARTGCRTILLDNGHETEWQLGPFRWPDAVVRDLREAADMLSLDQGKRAVSMATAVGFDEPLR